MNTDQLEHAVSELCHEQMSAKATTDGVFGPVQPAARIFIFQAVSAWTVLEATGQTEQLAPDFPDLAAPHPRRRGAARAASLQHQGVDPEALTLSSLPPTPPRPRARRRLTSPNCPTCTRPTSLAFDASRSRSAILPGAPQSHLRLAFVLDRCNLHSHKARIRLTTTGSKTMKTSGISCEPRTWTKLAPVVTFLTAMAIDACQLIPAAHLVRSAHAEGSEPLSEPAERGRHFSERDIRGPYGFFFQGFVTLTLPGDSTLSVPVSAVGQLVADGMGGLPEGSRTLNFGGVVLEQEAEGSYEVRPDGTGTATIEVTIVDQIGTPPPGLDIPSTTIETFSFVLTNRAAGIPFIGRHIVAADSGEPVGALTIRGEAHRQR